MPLQASEACVRVWQSANAVARVPLRGDVSHVEHEMLKNLIVINLYMVRSPSVDDQLRGTEGWVINPGYQRVGDRFPVEFSFFFSLKNFF